MKKTIVAIAAISTLSCLSVAHAGSMGPVSNQPSAISFLGLEGLYNWVPKSTANFNALTTSTTNNGWGGRLSAGIIHPYTEKLSFSGELGGGYYGSTKVNLAGSGFTSQHSFTGYDLLVGAIYKCEHVDIFGQMGVMIENANSKSTDILSQTIPGGFIKGTVKDQTSKTEALPELKVGGLYNINDQWGVSLAYMHVFGTTPESTVNMSAKTTGITENITNNNRLSTFDTVLLGLRYNFA